MVVTGLGNPNLMRGYVEKGVVHEIDLSPADDEEIQATLKVMGGDDWERWVAHLHHQRRLNPGFKTVSYTYIGSELTWPIYWEGTLGKAKEDLDRAAAAMRTPRPRKPTLAPSRSAPCATFS